MAGALMVAPATARGESVKSEAITVQASVKNSCKTFAVPLLFGTLPTANFKVDKDSVIHLTCTPGLVVTVMIDDAMSGMHSTVPVMSRSA